MNARAVALWSAAALTGALITLNPVYRVLVLVAALAFLAAAGREQVSPRAFVWIVLLSMPTSIVLSVLLNHSGRHVLASIPGWLPVVGGAITLEAVAFGVTAGLGIAAAIAAAWPLHAVLDAHQLVDALPGPLVRTGAVVGTALNLVPAIARSYRDVSEAQGLRLPDTRGLRHAAGVAVPVTLTAMESSIQLAEAMEARAFGSGPRTKLVRATWALRDVGVALGALVALGLFVFASLGGQGGDWYPEPSVVLPPINLYSLVACALLALPALLWHSSSSTV